MKRRLLVPWLLIAALVGIAAELVAQERPAVGVWNFDEGLADQSGRGNDAFAESPTFVAGHAGQGLRCGKGAVVVTDSPELRPAPGLRIECWVKLEALGTSWQPLVIKERGYQLRLDPPSEGGFFSFFVYLNGWEPRIHSKMPAEVGAWYHLAAGWDGKEIWMEVNGQRTSKPRVGAAVPSNEPVELGQFDGILDEVRIENPSAPAAGVAQWLFEGDLHDTSGHGHDLSSPDAAFVPVPGGQALQPGSGKVAVASHPDLQLAAGLRIDCSVCLPQVPAEGRNLIVKGGEYQLRVDPQKEGGQFAFFANLDGWEPRVRSTEPVVPGRWYRLTARWDGSVLTLDVNGKRSRVVRSGVPKASGNPLVIGGPETWIDNLKIENPRLPALLIGGVRQEHAILLVGRSERLTTTIRNVGSAAGAVVVRCRLPANVRCLGPASLELGEMPTGAEKPLAWSIEADAPVLGAAEMEIAAADGAPTIALHPLVFFPSEEELPLLAVAGQDQAAKDQAATYYVDGVSGDNARAGTSPEAAWKDFTPINGRTLGAGERLLLRRGCVFNQELNVSACGTEDRWAEIGAYGDGARPIVCRNGDIDDRCALVRNPDFLSIRGLTFCRAAKGLTVSYSEPGHRGLAIDDCIAHHIEGLYRFNAHGIPEWRDRTGAPGDGLNHSSGIAIVGPAAQAVLRNCEMYQCSSGFFVSGSDVVVDRVFCHDNYAFNTSPHPFLVAARRTVLQNSIFDASGYHASAGTMGIMLAANQGQIIRNCYFRNQPDSGSHDEGGIDFENTGNGCLIDRCTFENNAGAPIEVLGLQSPQTTNIEIRDSRFFGNNTASKLGPSEIFVWGRTADPSVACSNGSVRGNGYVLLPGVAFFVNEAPQMTSWTLADNTQYANAAELDRAMPYNRPPTIDAGPDIRTDQRRVALAGRVDDDGRPAGKPLGTTWELMEGPGPVAFDDPRSPATSATFDQPGDYVLRLVADDGEHWLCGRTVVHVLPSGTSVVKAWEFNRNLDKEGWTEVNPGTRVEQWETQGWASKAEPVKYVAGGRYVLAIAESTDAHLLSADHLDVDLTGTETFTLCFQNHTPATRMRLMFTTDDAPAWDQARSCTFAVVANDLQSRVYSVDLSAIPGWKGRLRQLRLDLATGEPLTGTCRFDYIWLVAGAARK